MFIQFLNHLQHYTVEILPALAVGFLLSGLIQEFLPQTFINKYLVQKNIKSILYTTLIGVLVPICCIGSLPVAVTLRRKGVPLGPILAFLVATPATSVTAIFVTWRLMGLEFTLYLCLTVVIIGLIIGIIGNLIKFEPVKLERDTCHMPEESTCHMPEESLHANHKHHKSCIKKSIKSRIISALSFGFVDLPKEIGLELIIGLILAAIVASLTPIRILIENYLVGSFGYFFAVILGLIMYICATASVALVHAFITQGLNIGAGMVLLLVGPITSYVTILVIRKEFGNKILLLYLTVICVVSLISGYLFTKLHL